MPIANHVLNEEEGDLYDVTWKRYAETAAKDLVPKEGLSDEKYAGICRCFEEKLYVIVYRTAVLLKKHPEKLCLTCRIETDIFNFAKIMFKKLRLEFPLIHVGDELPFYCMNLIFYCKYVIISI